MIENPNKPKRLRAKNLTLPQSLIIPPIFIARKIFIRAKKKLDK